jgi:Zn-dependent M28 family amino/carboxypeptidase
MPASGEKPHRTLVFVAFAGEEAGLLGSRHYVEHPPFPLEKTMGVINLDTVGRLFDRKLSVLATGSASEWQQPWWTAGSCPEKPCRFMTTMRPCLAASPSHTPCMAM